VVKGERKSLIEQQLIEKAKHGDPACFDQLVEMHTPSLYKVVLRLANDRGEAENIVQETWFRVWKSLDRCRTDQPFFPWLAKIALNVARDAWRKKKPLDFVDLGESTEKFVSEELGVEENLEKEEAILKLLEGVQALREEYRLVIGLRYDGAMSYKEMAEILDIPVNTVRTYLHRAKTSLRRWMEGEDVRLVG
jgi:RNA polymerase sigma-70 factor (ECF subfamily)